MATMNRGTLLKMAKAGKLVMVGSYHFDDMIGESRGAKEIPVRIRADYNDFIEGQCNLWESDFKSKCGRAWRNDNGTYCLYVHSNCNYDLKEVER